MKIEWANEFRDDGSPRRPPPSKMHGWLAKMRGTLLGNEELRSRGMREMKEADRRKRDEKAQRKRGGLFAIFTTGKSSKARRQATRQPSRHLSKSRGANTSTKPSNSRSHSTQSRSTTRPSTSRRSTAQSSRKSGTSRPQYSNLRRSSRR